MTDTRAVAVIPGAVGAAGAVRIVASLAGDGGAHVEREVIYPYYCFDARCRVPTMAGRKPVETVCLVDAVNAIGATADGFELRTESVPACSIKASAVGPDAAAGIARRTVTHRLGNALRTIADFDVALSGRGLVHKRFWIVRTCTTRLLVDSTTAGWIPLGLEAA